MKYKWLAERDTDHVSKKMTRLGQKGWRLVGYGDNSSYWWAIMEKDEGPVEDD